MLISTDPGANGGIAAYNPVTRVAVAFPIPDTRRDLINLLRQLTDTPQDCTAYIEHLHGYVPPNSNHAHLFNFGRNVERPEAILETLGVRIILVTPQAWQKALSLGHRERPPKLPRKPSAEQIRAHKNAQSRMDTKWKNHLKSEAERRFPGIKVTLAISDCLLILDYARMKEGVAAGTAEQDLLS